VQYLPEKLDALKKWCERLDMLAGNYENMVLISSKSTQDYFYNVKFR
ncbi:Hypothetical protein PAU_00414, partial [Photorhabdus asymbiotica]